MTEFRTCERESNIELFRIVLMLMIITHHFVVNSGIVLFPEIETFEGLTDNFVVNTTIAQLMGGGVRLR